MKFEIVSHTEKNSKGLTHKAITNDGHLIAYLRSDDVSQFNRNQLAANSKPVEFLPYSGYLIAKVRVKKSFGRDFKAFEIITIGYSHDGMDLTGNGQNAFVNVSGSAMSNSYEKPVALPLIDSDTIETSHGSFKLSRVGSNFKIQKI